MSGGSIAGIVIGSIVGTLLILWIWWTARAESPTPRAAESSVGKTRRRRRRTSTREGRTAYVQQDGKTYRVREPSRVYVAAG